jgi:hypothetical protein
LSRFPAAFRLPAFASRSSDSRRGIGPSLRSAYRPRAGPRRGYHVPHARASTGVGAPSTPRTAVLSRLKSSPWPAPAASQRPVPAPRYNIPSNEVPLHEASTRVQAIHPSGLPLACSPRMERAPLGFPPSFEPHRLITGDARRGGEQATNTGPELHAQHHISRSSNPCSSLNACDLVSHDEQRASPAALASLLQTFPLQKSREDSRRPPDARGLIDEEKRGFRLRVLASGRMLASCPKPRPTSDARFRTDCRERSRAPAAEAGRLVDVEESAHGTRGNGQSGQRCETMRQAREMLRTSVPRTA